mmetsp:Transcript_76729/g.128958  ORF Transcript_76729/g.128958 Transcript_76729/m.128958 type:complete len:525 (-) Transcript_76729:28-1602(-)|eukprot:CAMPEP_0174329820 /NCGR_PEP_ID=MMETSP0810-20121108/16169_1 /TAXON_ID=73025 ORGANISM="Eutreptiella gymnastica-like, Strain CCMP1594" /NCGR_SAMPLE_ID=MMETSP0810 /ASSEMBLY_ACC=CAM_ASM_000659 /LENGTH=524 /DNA_ID=CAMNT_0015444589 /DNA_START=140 /DNA_END=1714 /DNA_ORIENTATION=-
MTRSAAAKYQSIEDPQVYEKDIDVAEMQKLKDWLSERGLKKYINVFVQNEVYALQDLAMLNSSDLVEMGIKAVGARRKLLCHTTQLQADLKSSKGEAANRSALDNLPPITQGAGRGAAKQIPLQDEPYDVSQSMRDEVNGWDLEPKEKQGKVKDADMNFQAAAPPVEERSVHRPASFLESRLEFQQAVAPAMAELEGEKMVLESINEAATMLLTYEKEDAGAQDNYFPGKFQGTHALEVDVAFFRKRMQDRIDYFTAERTPPASARTQARAWGKEWLARRVGTEHLPKVDYRAMIEEQAAMNAEMDKVHQRYQELLAKCLETVEEDLAKHANVGEYRDAGEYRLKMQLAKLIGMVDSSEVDKLEAEEATHQARLGITDTTLSRRQLIHQEYEKLCAQLGLPPDAIMDTKEIRRACKNDPEFQRQLEVLAFNLALDPENRMVADNDAINAETQAQLEELVASIQTDDNLLISREELDSVPQQTITKLITLGMPDIFGESRRGSLMVRRPSQPFYEQGLPQQKPLL